MSTTDTTASVLADFNSIAAKRHRGLRHIKDNLFRYLMTAGGIGVIVAIVLIAFYLFYVVLPMFKPAHIEKVAGYVPPGMANSRTFYYALEEQNRIALRANSAGELVFFHARDGEIVKKYNLFAGTGEEITAFHSGDPAQALLAFATASGKVLLLQHRYEVTYPESLQKDAPDSRAVKQISPYLTYPLGEDPLQLTDNIPVRLIAAQSDDEQTTIAAFTANKRLLLENITVETNLITKEKNFTESRGEISVSGDISHIILDKEQRELYIASKQGDIYFYNVSNIEEPLVIDHVKAVPEGVEITSMDFLSGGISILVGDSRGRITQWFPVRDKNNNYSLEEIRYFNAQHSPITDIQPEYFRKVFLAVDASGGIGIYNTTAHRTVKHEQISNGSIGHVAISPRADGMFVESGDGQLQFWHVDNEHPEISWQSIWGKVWYESREKPEYIWQSSSASNDFEPKFSLTPLLFGTLKAAFFAMLFAIPLAILGAIYTAYFMSPKLRSTVKPTIEIMEALPTVILGFLAGLWFAPYVEKNLPGILLLLLFVPLSILAAAYCWHLVPGKFRNRVADGWEAALLIPVVLLSGYLALLLSNPVEHLLFAGNMPLWLTQHGIDFDQRNSLVVGIAMGFAVIPTIFSISEDAIYSVPRHLTTGSLALGATTWQTMVRIVLLTASPGIFSAVMIGLGRAVGETMIVVMATGNTAIMDMNIFQGFRALSANIAVEMPESEVGSTHYRILFLAGLVLFMVTFFVNTLAEIVRQRLRRKYSSL
ncbi:MAG TPA: ABC transporter permease subunit [Gammaproteobacteria bacterium]|nr:ABC transporter permease subunit [Gammaproteobacteria bacterium]